MNRQQVVTLLLGIGLGAGCVLAVLKLTTNPRQHEPGGAVGKSSDLQDQDADPAAYGGYAVTSGAAHGYIDDRSCADCHGELHKSFQESGMARSFSRPSAANFIEDFEAGKFFHAPTHRHYEMSANGDQLVFRRYQVDGDGKPINEYVCSVDWILGSGKHARNYLTQSESGEMYQLPVAWYSQERRWGMAAGFDNPSHAGVTKQVTRECMFCHNAYPDVEQGSDLYPLARLFPKELPEGIGCQRCHGPGAEHVRVARAKSAPIKEVRSTIVNPAHLDGQLQADVCNQCHLQPSVAIEGVRRFGRADYSYRPGQRLDEYLVGLDIEQSGKAKSERFEINHHAYRMQQSRCFIKAEGQLSCLTCHDAHHTVRSEEREKYYADACAKCHQPDSCTLEPGSESHPAGVAASDCVTCHMPKRRTQDAVHVVMTDHMIRKAPPDASYLAAIPEAKVVLQQLLLRHEENTEPTDVDNLYRAVAALRLSQYTHIEAANELENLLVSVEPKEVEPYLDLTMAQLKQRRFAAAGQTANLVLQQFANHPLALEWKGTSLLSLRKLDPAAKQFQEALDASPDRPETHYNLGLLLLGQDRPDQAVKRFQQAIELRPNMAIASFYLGQAYKESKQADDAIRAYRKTLDIAPNFANAYLQLGESLLALDRRDDARRYLQHGMKVLANPKPLTALFQQAEYAAFAPILSEEVTAPILEPVNAALVPVSTPQLDRLEESVAKQIQEFLDDFQKLSAGANVSAANLAEGYATLGQLYHAYEFNESAERCYINAIRLLPDADRSYHLLGALYQQVGQLEAAETYLNVAMKLRGDNVAGAVRLGMIKLELNQPVEASARFQYALARDPDCAAAHNGLGDVALAEEKYQEAVSHYQEALKRVPGANRVHYSLGMAYRGLGEAEKAKEHLDQRGTVGLRPDDPLVDALPTLLAGERVYLIRGQLAFSAGRFVEAEKAYAKAVAANPESVSALVNHGAALAKLGRSDAAIERLQQALALEPENSSANYNLAGVLTTQGKHDEAVERFRATLLKLPDDVTVRRQLAVALRAADREEEAIKELESLVADAPDDELALLELSSLLVKRAAYASALKLLDEAATRFPDRGLTTHALARLLSTCPDESLRDGKRAVALAGQVATAKQTVRHLETLAMALAESGECKRAAALQKQLIEQAEKAQQSELAQRLRTDLARYEKGTPCRPLIEPVAPVPSTSREDTSEAPSELGTGAQLPPEPRG